jgi:hypothetical protein
MIATRNRLYAFMLAVCAAGWAWLAVHLGKSAALNVQLCWIKATTGMPCPACGTTRAVDALMHGHLWEAMLINPFGLPALLLMAAATDLAGVVDVALVLALLGAFASVAFVLAARGLGAR